ncbi:MAG: alginate O-acetyltransferase AlgF [Deinococcota bacterium]
MALILALCSGLVWAQDEALYPDPPPANAAFVRFVDAGAVSNAVDVTLADVTYILEPLGFTPYRPIIEGESSWQALGSVGTLTLAAQGFYTVVLRDGADGVSALLIEDILHDNRARTLLMLYNLTDVSELYLKTADGSVDIVSAVTPDTVGGIQVNPIAVDLGVFELASDTPIATFEGVTLAQGAVYSTFVVATGDTYYAVFVATETVLE